MEPIHHDATGVPHQEVNKMTEFEQVHEVVHPASLLHPVRARVLYDFVRATRPASVLELGFAHGASSCYIAAALEANDHGHLLTIDNRDALARSPRIDELLTRTGLSHRVTTTFAERSYTWELMKLLQRQADTSSDSFAFDFCFIDGAHQWDADGFAFLMVLERLLSPGGWVLFDDLEWTIGGSEAMKDEQWVKDLPEEERATAQVELVVRLLAARHPLVQKVDLRDGWAWVQKRAEGQAVASASSSVAQVYENQGLGEFAFSAARRAWKGWQRLSGHGMGVGRS